jgi:hypothetical protein
MSSALTLQASANDFSFSYLAAFRDFISGQKNILTPEGVSVKVQKKSQCQRPEIKEVPGLKAFLFMVKR